MIIIVKYYKTKDRTPFGNVFSVEMSECHKTFKQNGITSISYFTRSSDQPCKYLYGNKFNVWWETYYMHNIMYKEISFKEYGRIVFYYKDDMLHNECGPALIEYDNKDEIIRSSFWYNGERRRFKTYESFKKFVDKDKMVDYFY